MSNSRFDVITLGESMALFVAEESGPLNRVERFTKRLAGSDHVPSHDSQT